MLSNRERLHRFFQSFSLRSDDYPLYSTDINKRAEMTYMNTQILNYVQQIESAVLYDLVTTDTSDIYNIASEMIAENTEAYEHICQAYEVVKHNLLG